MSVRLRRNMQIQETQLNLDRCQRNGTVEKKSILTACIKSHKKEIRGFAKEDHSYYGIKLDTTALALIICYVGPHCSTFAKDLADFEKFLTENLNDQWLDKESAIEKVKMTPLQARERLDRKGYKFKFDCPLDLFLTA